MLTSQTGWEGNYQLSILIIQFFFDIHYFDIFCFLWKNVIAYFLWHLLDIPFSEYVLYDKYLKVHIIFAKSKKHMWNCKIFKSFHVSYIIKSGRCTRNFFHMILLHLLCDFLLYVVKRSDIKKLLKQTFKGN